MVSIRFVVAVAALLRPGTCLVTGRVRNLLAPSDLDKPELVEVCTGQASSIILTTCVAYQRFHNHQPHDLHDQLGLSGGNGGTQPSKPKGRWSKRQVGESEKPAGLSVLAARRVSPALNRLSLSPDPSISSSGTPAVDPLVGNAQPVSGSGGSASDESGHSDPVASRKGPASGGDGESTETSSQSAPVSPPPQGPPAPAGSRDDPVNSRQRQNPSQHASNSQEPPKTPRKASSSVSEPPALENPEEASGKGSESLPSPQSMRRLRPDPVAQRGGSTTAATAEKPQNTPKAPERAASQQNSAEALGAAGNGQESPSSSSTRRGRLSPVASRPSLFGPKLATTSNNQQKDEVNLLSASPQSGESSTDPSNGKAQSENPQSGVSEAPSSSTRNSPVTSRPNSGSPKQEPSQQAPQLVGDPSEKAEEINAPPASPPASPQGRHSPLFGRPSLLAQPRITSSGNTPKESQQNPGTLETPPVPESVPSSGRESPLIGRIGPQTQPAANTPEEPERHTSPNINTLPHQEESGRRSPVVGRPGLSVSNSPEKSDELPKSEGSNSPGAQPAVHASSPASRPSRLSPVIERLGTTPQPNLNPPENPEELPKAGGSVPKSESLQNLPVSKPFRSSPVTERLGINSPQGSSELQRPGSGTSEKEATPPVTVPGPTRADPASSRPWSITPGKQADSPQVGGSASPTEESPASPLFEAASVNLLSSRPGVNTHGKHNQSPPAGGSDPQPEPSSASPVGKPDQLSESSQDGDNDSRQTSSSSPSVHASEPPRFDPVSSRPTLNQPEQPKGSSQVGGSAPQPKQSGQASVPRPISAPRKLDELSPNNGSASQSEGSPDPLSHGSIPSRLEPVVSSPEESKLDPVLSRLRTNAAGKIIEPPRHEHESDSTDQAGKSSASSVSPPRSSDSSSTRSATSEGFTRTNYKPPETSIFDSSLEQPEPTATATTAEKKGQTALAESPVAKPTTSNGGTSQDSAQKSTHTFAWKGTNGTVAKTSGLSRLPIKPLSTMSFVSIPLSSTRLPQQTQGVSFVSGDGPSAVGAGSDDDGRPSVPEGAEGGTVDGSELHSPTASSEPSRNMTTIVLTTATFTRTGCSPMNGCPDGGLVVQTVPAYTIICPTSLIASPARPTSQPSDDINIDITVTAEVTIIYQVEGCAYKKCSDSASTKVVTATCNPAAETGLPLPAELGGFVRISSLIDASLPTENRISPQQHTQKASGGEIAENPTHVGGADQKVRITDGTLREIGASNGESRHSETVESQPYLGAHSASSSKPTGPKTNSRTSSSSSGSQADDAPGLSGHQQAEDADREGFAHEGPQAGSALRMSGKQQSAGLYRENSAHESPPALPSEIQQIATSSSRSSLSSSKEMSSGSQNADGDSGSFRIGGTSESAEHQHSEEIYREVSAPYISEKPPSEAQRLDVRPDSAFSPHSDKTSAPKHDSPSAKTEIESLRTTVKPDASTDASSHPTSHATHAASSSIERASPRASQASNISDHGSAAATDGAKPTNCSNGKCSSSTVTGSAAATGATNALFVSLLALICTLLAVV
ncbi:hypothetical protein CDD83_4280 [Cordyceps sp. RAO-2017]|nr:hypothetical protein CDD83_4280 [Cordyceps sp. RAO-2017]